MRNANWTRILTILLSLLALYALFAVFVGVVQRFITPILLIVLASLIAFVLTPVVDLIQHRANVFRWVAILVTYLLLIGVLGMLGYFMTTPLIDQTKALTSAIKNPSASNLYSMTRLDTATTSYLKQVVIYQANTAQTKVDPATGSHICLPNDGTCANAPCYAAYFLGETGYPGQPPLGGVWATSSCGDNRPNSGNAVWANWRTGNGPLGGTGILHPFKVMRPIVGGPVSRIGIDIALLSKSSVRTADGGSSRSATIPTTQVPSSYLKPVKAELATLRRDLHAGVSALKLQTGTYLTDAAKILKDAQALAAGSKKLHNTVKTTPIVVMAAQNFIDQHHIPFNVGSTVSSAITKVRGQSTTVLNNAVSILTGTINVIFDVIIILIMSLYLLADGARFIGWVMGLVPERHREQAWFFMGSLNRVLGGYVRGQLIVAITIGILAGIGCWVIGVPYALLLGIFAFLAESIPVMGPIIASIPAILVALFTLPLLKTLIVVGWFIFIQQIEQNVVGPRITGHAVGIHPIVAMVAVIVGLEIGGIWGAFLAVPVAGILFVVVGEGYRYLILQRPLSTAEVPESLEVEGAEHRSGGGGRSAAQ